MSLTRAVLAALLLGPLLPALAAADIAPSPRDTPAPAERRTGRVPATVTVTPSSAQAPTHMVITVPREVLRQVMAGSPTAGTLEVAPADDAGPAGGPRARHVVGAVALALAIATLPLVWRGRRRTVVAVALLGAALAGGVLLGADRADAGFLQRPTPKTVEFVIVPGRGPVRVAVTYAP
ncbi:hypothetical protein TBR22_A15320 [Luteitalea sp. TBR-22]|uniref:hypothetical protein n=1 Tax=Luteitalea sp. TBR-22 TaxID=2802971 RepID=UPI001AF21266|nr:hypothetical protein [Luteitalea sp. TBR-22]BCS32322.1 hypothetical protein TBR22_A15320 [Luteitalea sp. TBR-22]